MRIEKIVSNKEELLRLIPDGTLGAEIGNGHFTENIRDHLPSTSALCTSVKSLKKLPDEFFDWIYLNSDIETFKEDLNVCSKKVKVGGLVCGSNYRHGGDSYAVSVRSVTHEILDEYDFNFKYLTDENDGNLSFAVSKQGSIPPLKSLLIFVHYNREKPYLHLPEYVKKYVKILMPFFTDTVISSNYKGPEWNGVPIMRFENLGYDFGFFYQALQNIELGEYERIAFVNDSNEVVKLGSFNDIFEWANQEENELWGVTDADLHAKGTVRHKYHVQSHFLVFEKKGIELLSSFFEDIDFEKYLVPSTERLRSRIIKNCEIGLTQYFFKNGLKARSYFSVNDAKCPKPMLLNCELNVHVDKWKELIDSGYPLIKRKIVSGHYSAVLNNWEKHRDYLDKDEQYLDPHVVMTDKISHKHWPDYLRKLGNKEGFRVLEIGSRDVTGQRLRNNFNKSEYVGFDYYAGDNVDVVGDAHKLSSYFKEDEKFDLIYSNSCFEHFAMPWIVATEIAKMLKVGGFVFIETHFSYSSHARPCHFFQFSDMALKTLFSNALGFECIEAGLCNPIVGRFSSSADDYLRNKPVEGLYCHSEYLGKKVKEVADFSWHNVDLEEVVDAKYPNPNFLNVATPCSRPENLLKIATSIKENLDKDYCWHVIFDEKIFNSDGFNPVEFEDVKNKIKSMLPDTIFYINKSSGKAGHCHRNYILDIIEKSKGWVYFQDDDNIMSEDFRSIQGQLDLSYPAVVLSQKNHDGTIRETVPSFDGEHYHAELLIASPKNMKAHKIDTAQLIYNLDYINGQCFEEDYNEADGMFAEEFYNKHKKALFLKDKFCYYNFLRPH